MQNPTGTLKDVGRAAATYLPAGKVLGTMSKTRVGSALTRGGFEIPLGSRFRISPFGNSGALGKGGIGKNWAATLPHYHYRPIGGSNKIFSLHRPWQTSKLLKRWF